MGRLAVLCGCLVLLGGAEAALGHDVSSPTTAALDGLGESDEHNVTVLGHLESTADACSAGREVQVFARYGKWTHRHVWAPGEWELLETLRTGADGSFAATMDRPTLWSMKFVVPRTDTGRRGHRHVCGAASRGLGFQ